MGLVEQVYFRGTGVVETYRFISRGLAVSGYGCDWGLERRCRAEARRYKCRGAQLRVVSLLLFVEL